MNASATEEQRGMDLSRDELARYARQINLAQVGEEGQRRLKKARVLCIGAGGLGSPAALYLSAAGIGTIGIVDQDTVHQFEGQASLFAPHLGGPCYRCLFPEPPPPEAIPSCAEAGVLGVVPGLLGIIQALEAIKLIIGAGDNLIGRLLHIDALTMRFRE